MSLAVFREPLVPPSSSPVAVSPGAQAESVAEGGAAEEKAQQPSRWRLPGLVERLKLSGRAVLADRTNVAQADKRHASMLRADASISRPACDDMRTPGTHGDAASRGHNADPLVCAEYMAEITDHLLRLEASRRPRERFLGGQADIRPAHRFILVNWLVELAYELELEAETLHLAVNYIDRFLSLKRVPRRFLQTLGTSALFIAAKYEEIDPCTLSDLVQLCDNVVREDELVAMEQAILDVLHFNMNAATILLFAKRLLHLTRHLHEGDKRVEYLTFYLVDLVLADYDMLAFRYSDMALAAVMLALYTLRYTCWTSSLEKFTETPTASFMSCIQRAYNVYVSVDKESASYKQFCRVEKERVAILIKPRGLPPAYRAPPTPASDMKENVKLL